MTTERLSPTQGIDGRYATPVWPVGPVRSGWISGYQARSEREAAGAARMDADPGESDPLVIALR